MFKAFSSSLSNLNPFVNNMPLTDEVMKEWEVFCEKYYKTEQLDERSALTKDFLGNWPGHFRIKRSIAPSKEGDLIILELTDNHWKILTTSAQTEEFKKQEKQQPPRPPVKNHRDWERHLQFNNYIKKQGKMKDTHFESRYPSVKLYLEYLHWVIMECKPDSTRTCLNACYLLGQVEAIESFVSDQIFKRNSGFSAYVFDNFINVDPNDFMIIDSQSSKSEVIHKMDQSLFDEVNSSLHTSDINRAIVYWMVSISCLALSTFIDYVRQEPEVSSLLELPVHTILFWLVCAATSLVGLHYYASSNFHGRRHLLRGQAIEWVDCPAGHHQNFIRESVQQAIVSIQKNLSNEHEPTTALTLTSLVTTRYATIREGGSDFLPRLVTDARDKVLSVDLDEDAAVDLEDVVNRLRLKLDQK